jgi:steroid delta-isomerase-like uncharacterized protein
MPYTGSNHRRGPAISAEENATKFVRYFTEVLGAGKLDLIDELFAGDCVVRGPHIAQPIQGTAALKHAVTGFRTRYADMAVTIDDVVAGEDHVVARWTLHGAYEGGPLSDFPELRPGTFTVPVVGLFRLGAGKVTDYWDHPDLLNRWRQVVGRARRRAPARSA